MTNPFIGNATKTTIYISLWILFSILISIAEYGLIALPWWMLMVDGCVHGILFGLLGVLLWTVVRYGNFAVLPVFQRHINMTALAILLIGIWIGGGYELTNLIVGNVNGNLFVPFIPTRTLIGILVYLILNQRIRAVHIHPKSATHLPSIEESEPVQAEEPGPQAEIIERIGVKSGSKIHMILVPDIVYLQADGDYVQIVTTQGKYLKEQTMKYFEEHLPNNQFVRVHRSIIVNVEMISRIELYEKQSQQLTLKNGQQIKTSPAGYKALRAVLKL
jgi:LytTr DNA-binding domain